MDSPRSWRCCQLEMLPRWWRTLMPTSTCCSEAAFEGCRSAWDNQPSPERERRPKRAQLKGTRTRICLAGSQQVARLEQQVAITLVVQQPVAAAGSAQGHRAPVSDIPCSGFRSAKLRLEHKPLNRQGQMAALVLLALLRQKSKRELHLCVAPERGLEREHKQPGREGEVQKADAGNARRADGKVAHRERGDQGAGPRHFGVCVSALTGEKDSVPVVMEKLLEHVEMHGLYTEGIYRKSGSANRMKELKQLLQADPNSVQLEKYPIHTITGIFKQWLRELPEPLMTFSQYHDFLRAVELPGQQEQLAAIYSTLEQLPQAHHDTLERLIFHLVKVALVEDVNRMSPNALAIVFAPCLLRCPDHSDPLTSMKDVSKTTICVEMIIKEQMRKYQVKMQEICQLEAAETIAFRRLSLLRQSTLCPVKLGFSSPREGARAKDPQGADADGGTAARLGALPEEEEPDSGRRSC
ncbi:unconventional myosin-IXb-like [Varanus komodoensis]|uniref:unconventional myosin-IXb-like n=1 Tax=Varanus komodoensis TaxID=61221 RepID=UPI001CF773EF|nr:unconventional myosin-IXb-like [Varanus komodoensis]